MTQGAPGYEFCVTGAMTSRSVAISSAAALLGAILGASSIPLALNWFPRLSVPDGAFWVALEFGVVAACAFGAFAAVAVVFLPPKRKRVE